MAGAPVDHGDGLDLALRELGEARRHRKIGGWIGMVWLKRHESLGRHGKGDREELCKTG